MSNWPLAQVKRAQAAIHSIVFGEEIRSFPHQWLLTNVIYPPMPPAGFNGHAFVAEGEKEGVHGGSHQIPIKHLNTSKLLICKNIY